MKNCKMVVVLFALLYGVLLSTQSVNAQEKAAPGTAQVHVVITDTALRSDSEVPRLRQDEVKVKQGKTFLQVSQLIPAQGENATLQLMILIDATLDTSSTGNNLNDIKAQPSSTAIAAGYMANATVTLLQTSTAISSIIHMRNLQTSKTACSKLFIGAPSIPFEGTLV